jgi:hypothetical protein
MTVNWNNANDEQAEAVEKHRIQQEHLQTVRGVCETETTKYEDETLSADEKKKLVSAIKEEAHRWGVRSYDFQSAEDKVWMKPGLDLRLDCLSQTYKMQLVKLIEKCAVNKLKKLEIDRAASHAALTPTPNNGPANQANSEPKRLSKQF